MNEESAQTAESENAPGRPDIGRFTDYRSYLRDMVVFLRATRPGFSFRSFARRAGFSSPNYLKLVADGLRNLAPESVDKFARGLGLSKREGDVFRLLVLLANARNDEERNATYARLRERVVADEVTRLRDDQFAVYDIWWALVVREMVQLPDFQLDARWIARRLRPRVRPAQAQRAIDLLLRLGLIVNDGTNGDRHVKCAERTITTGPDVTPLGVRNYHRAHLELAARSLDEVPKAERNITSVSVVLSPEGYAEAVEEIARLRRRLLEIADNPARSRGDGSSQQACEPGEREVYSTVIALFPVSQKVRERRGSADDADGDEDTLDSTGDGP